MMASCYFNSQIGRDGEPRSSSMVRSEHYDRNAHLSVNLIPWCQKRFTELLLLFLFTTNWLLSLQPIRRASKKIEWVSAVMKKYLFNWVIILPELLSSKLNIFLTLQLLLRTCNFRLSYDISWYMKLWLWRKKYDTVVSVILSKWMAMRQIHITKPRDFAFASRGSWFHFFPESRLAPFGV